MSKTEIIHYDFFGNRIKENDIVIISDGNRGKLKIARVIKLTNKMVTVDAIKSANTGYNRSMLRYPTDLVLIDEDVAANYLLINSK